MFLKLFVKSRLFVLLSLLSNFFGLRVRGYGFAPNHNQQGYVAPTFYMCFCYTIFESPHFGQKYAKQYQTNIQCFPTTCSLSMFLFPFRLFALQQISFYQKRLCFFSTEERSFYRQIQILQWSRVTQLLSTFRLTVPFFLRDVTLRKCVAGIFKDFSLSKLLLSNLSTRFVFEMDGISYQTHCTEHQPVKFI